LYIPTIDELTRGYEAYRLNGERDAMYKIATFLADHFWGRPADMADSIGVFLLTWNNSYYRYGSFDFGMLETCLSNNMSILTEYRAKTILEYTEADDPHIKYLFETFLPALARPGAPNCAVSVAKSLHLLAPGFFPLWDKNIAVAYRCDYSRHPIEKYIAFLRISQSIARNLQAAMELGGKTALKLIDEYNYAKYTKKRI
jgi:hypothetical protein